MHIPVSFDAERLNANFLNCLESRIAVNGDLYFARRYCVRFRSNLPRLAGLLHLARRAPTLGDELVGRHIDKETMAAAIEVATYLLEEGVAALYQRPDGRPGLSLVNAIERLLQDSPSWVGSLNELAEVLERTVPAPHRADWPQGTNNLMGALRLQLGEMAARGITWTETRTSQVRMVALSRRIDVPPQPPAESPAAPLANADAKP
jgi:hypothetical protein